MAAREDCITVPETISSAAIQRRALGKLLTSPNQNIHAEIHLNDDEVIAAIFRLDDGKLWMLSNACLTKMQHEYSLQFQGAMVSIIGVYLTHDFPYGIFLRSIYA